MNTQRRWSSGKLAHSLAGTAAGLLLFFSAAAHADSVEIWGATVAQKRILEPAASAIKEATGVEIKVLGMNTGKGLLGLAEGKVQLCSVAETLEKAIEAAKKETEESGKTVQIPANLKYYEIMRDVVVPILHKDNPVTRLSWKQLTDINTGKIKNWKEVGGADLPIRVVTELPSDATRSMFSRIVMGGAEYTAEAVEIKTQRDAINEVSKYKGSIGAVSEFFFNQDANNTKKAETENPAAISRPIALVTIGEPSGDVKKLVDYLRSDAAKKNFK